jgi:hypothetical protein
MVKQPETMWVDATRIGLLLAGSPHLACCSPLLLPLLIHKEVGDLLQVTDVLLASGCFVAIDV